MELIIAFLIVAAFCYYCTIYRPSQRQQKEFDNSRREFESEQYEESEYVSKAMQFIEFCEILPLKSLLVITPDIIGIVIPDEKFGVAVKSYLTMVASDSREDKYREWFLKEVKVQLGGELGVEMFNKLSLQVKLHNNDEDWPVVYMDAFCYSDFDRESYIRAIELQYARRYQKTLSMHHLNSEF